MPEIKNKEIALKTPWFDLLKKTVAGMPGSADDEEYYSVLPRDYVTLLAVTKDNKIPVVRQYRPAIEAYSLELPAGTVEDGETPEESIKREFIEETGYKALNVELLGKMAPDTGRESNTLWCYFSSEIEECPRGKDLEEDIETKLYSLDQVKDLIRAGEFDHALHVAIFTLAELTGKISLNK